MGVIEGGLFFASQESSLAADQGWTDLTLLVLLVQLHCVLQMCPTCS